MTDEQLAAIRARCEASTPGPWKATKRGKDWWVMQEGGDTHMRGRVCLVDDNVPSSELDAHFIAHARRDVLDMLAEVEKAKAQVASYSRLLSHRAAA